MLKTFSKLFIFCFAFAYFQSIHSLEISPERKLLSEAIAQQDNAQVKYIVQTYQLSVDSLSEDSQTPLMEAAYHGDLSSLVYFIQNGANVNFKTKSGVWDTPLKNATAIFWRKGDGLIGDMVQALVDAGADINVPIDSWRPSPFMEACAENAVKTVNIFIRSGIDLDTCTSDGKTALMLAIDKKSNETASILIENGANVEMKDKEGKSAIFYAIEKNSPYLLSILLQGGADINVRDSTGTWPLMYALASGNPHIKETLIELTNNFKIVNYNNQSLLSFVARTSDIQTASLLLSKGLNIDQKSSKDGFTPFLEAVAANQTKMTKFLVEFGANPLSKNYQGTSAIYYAAKNGNKELLQFLVGHNVLIDTPDSYGLTPLMQAIINNHIDVVDYLISVGANLKAKTTSSVRLTTFFPLKEYSLPSGSTPLEIAHILKRDKIIELLN